MNIHDVLIHDIHQWAQIRVPSLHLRFVERNGRVFEAAPFTGKRGTPKQCFSNSVNYATRFGGTYVEGYVWRQGLPIIIHHAWVAHGDVVADPTLSDPEDCQYYGVEFDEQEVNWELLRNKYYSLLDPGNGLNLKLMFRRDPGLRLYFDEWKIRRGK